MDPANSRRHNRQQSQNHQTNSAGSYAGGPPVQVGASNSYGQPNQQPVNTPNERRPQGYPNNTPVAPALQQSYSSQGSPSGREWNAGHQPSHVRPESGNAVSLHNVQEQQHHYVHGTQVQPPARNMAGASGFSRSSNNICRIPDCSQLGFFNPHIQEQLDYCQAHLVTALGGYAAACKGCGRLPVLENSDYCSRFCAGGGRSAAIVPQGFAPACQECRRAITENMQIYGGHFCSPECWNAYLRTHSSRR